MAAAAAADPNYYDVLGVGPRVDRDSLKKAFHHLTKLYHPDKNPMQLHKFQEVSRAYRVLSDPEERQAYDLKLRRKVLQQQQQQQQQQSQTGGQDSGRSSNHHHCHVHHHHCHHHAWDASRVQIVRCSHCHGCGTLVDIQRFGKGLMKEIRIACRACSGRGTWVQLFSIQK